jgi:apolipoprotein D and lipocalin family protein
MTRGAVTLAALAGVIAWGCLSVPPGIEPVRFERERYLGTWYELMRYDHRFERGLERVQTRYEAREDGCVAVTNRGFDPEASEWREAEGRACPVSDPELAHLKVSFFGPFWASYVVFALDEDYRWAWVTSTTRGSLWLLAREPTLPEDELAQLLAVAEANGFDTDDLLRVPQP